MPRASSSSTPLKNSRLVQRGTRCSTRSVVSQCCRPRMRKAPEISSTEPSPAKTRIDLAAGNGGTGRELEGVVTRVGGKLDEPGGEMERILALALKLHMPKRRLLADSELGHRIALKPAHAEAGEAFNQRGRAAGLGNHHVPRDGRGRLALAVELDEMNRLVEGHTGADAQGSASRHQRGVKRNDRIVLARIDLSESGLEPGRRLLERLAERDAPRRRPPSGPRCPIGRP